MKIRLPFDRFASTTRTVGLAGLLLTTVACADSADTAPGETPAAAEVTAPLSNTTDPTLVEEGTPVDLTLDDDATVFDRVLAHYETARIALTQDTTEGVAEAGRAIEEQIASLEADWSIERAGIEATGAESVRALLGEARAAAASLAVASDLETARDAFYALSKPLVLWRKEATGERPQVAYCSMAERSWLQAEGELENPYYGHSMLNCGEMVDG